MRIDSCRVNHLDNPLGYELDGLVFSWQVEDAKGAFQNAARIRAWREGELVADTGWADLDSLATPVALALEPRTRYTWTVAVRTDAGEESESETQTFETAKMDELWRAQWIGCDEAEQRHPVFSRYVEPVRAVRRARLYVCGLGLFDVFWNGIIVSSEHMAPYCTDYRSRVQYLTFDMTEQLQEAGELSITLGNGWFGGALRSRPRSSALLWWWLEAHCRAASYI